MSVVAITDHKAQAVARLLEQFKDKAKIVATQGAFADQYQDIEDAAISLITDRWIDTAGGVILDRIGAIVNAPRNGATDAAYRNVIYGEISKNQSFGRVEDLISIFKNTTIAAKVHYYERYPAESHMTAVDSALTTIDATTLAAALNKAKPAGVRLDAVLSVAPAFGFDGDPTALGFGDVTDPTKGGRFAFRVT